jgi:flagellar biosynthesis/type III secretory pathway M-ring protein FliF/YscJ
MATPGYMIAAAWVAVVVAVAVIAWIVIYGFRLDRQHAEREQAARAQVRAGRPDPTTAPHDDRAPSRSPRRD